MTVTAKSRCAEDTYDLARDLEQTLKSGSVVLLEGELGAGKTTFTQGLARALGITQPIKSPTFTMLWEYDIPERDMKLYHFDLYRLQKGDSTDTIGLDEALARKDGIVVIEWADKLLQYPAGTLVTIDRNEEGIRTIVMKEV